MFIVSDIQTDTQILELQPPHSVLILHASIVHIVLKISTWIHPTHNSGIHKILN